MNAKVIRRQYAKLAVEQVRQTPALAELQRYLDKFGNDGTGYFAAGLNYVDALSHAFDARGQRITQLECELASEKQKLAAQRLAAQIAA